MKLDDFDYEFPEEMVAQRPLPERDSSRMMILDRASGGWEHKKITDLPNHLKSGDVMVVNDSRVIPARIFGNLKGGRPVDLLLVEKITPHPHPLPPFDSAQGRQGERAKDERGGREIWRCLTKRVRNYRKGDKFFFGISATAEVAGRDGDFLLVIFQAGHSKRAIERCGVPPLPPYIRREDHKSYSDEDRERYQTVYANESGSVAAPTAGLHFTEKLIEEIEKSGVGIAKVTLHVGADTFAPVRVENIHEHKMHGETFQLTKENAEIINRAKKEKRRVVAVGTTTVRALESCFKDGRCAAGNNETELFITPGYKFNVVDAMLTNFHQPRSTLLMLVSAFAGRELVLSAYREAIKERYRLFSYGDCMLIL
jgi:S-adenosylmethionine:tRNA ribosyltransferase-isomerase